MKYAGPGFYGLQPPPWAASVEIAKGQWLTSPADNEIYQRIAATGTDTTDPADDLVKYVARSYERTAAIVGAAIETNAGSGFGNVGNGATKSSLAAIGVGARTNILSVSGRGSCDYLMFFKATTGTTLVEVFVDGRSVFGREDTYNATTGLVVIGQFETGAGSARLAAARFASLAIEFRRSLDVYITNTATASTTNAGLAYHLRSVA